MIVYERLEGEAISKLSVKDFSDVAYIFCHFIENYSDEGTYGMFLKEADIASLMTMEKMFIDDCISIPYRKHFMQSFGASLQRFSNKKVLKAIAEYSIRIFYEELSKMNKPRIKKIVERLGLD